MRQVYIEEICKYEKLSNLIRDSFGNYVMQTALKVAQKVEKQKLIAAIQKHIP